MTTSPAKSNQAPGRLSQRATVAAFLDDDFVWTAARRLEGLDSAAAEPARGGRPRTYPLVCALIWDGLVSVFGSARQVEVELACHESGWWDLVRRAAVRHNGLLLPDRPMRRHHYRYLRDRYLTADDTQLAELADSFTTHAAQLAVHIGLCDPDGTGSLTHPSPNRVVAGDGKVLTPRFRTSPKQRGVPDPATGEIRTRRADPDAALHVTGGGDQAFGTKYVLISTRGDARNQRVVLHVAHTPNRGSGGEAATALSALDATLPHLPGAQAVVYDGAMRGTHLHHLITRHGVVPLARMHKPRTGKHRDSYLGKVPVHRTGPTTSIDVHLLDGAPHLREVRADGTPVLEPLERTKLLRRRDANHWRLYCEYRVPAQHGGGLVRIRLDRTANDIVTGFNREEHLRPIPPADPDHHTLYARRNDTETGNRLLDDSMLRERAHTVGRRRQLLNLTTWAAIRNAGAAAQHSAGARSSGPPVAA